VIGSGPAGQRVALRAARDCRRVALIEQRQVLGGGCLHTSTIPSKTLREAVLYFTGHRLHSVYGFSYRLKDCITMQTVLVESVHTSTRLRGEKFVIVVGSKPVCPAHVSFMAGMAGRIIDSDGILQLPIIPRS
jgi:pyruvate/2-oxoglutarate dehydrogenase complex dihydrolipoamide dehydrogenase (E3) component